MDIYWFFPALFGVYLCMPLLAAVPRGRRKSVFGYLLVGGFAVNVLIPFVIRVSGLALRWPLSLSVAGGYLLFVIGGVYLHENPPARSLRVLFYALGLVGFLLHAVGTYRASLAAGQIVWTFKDYTNLPSVLYAFGVFLLLREAGMRIMRTKAAGAIRFLAGYSFPVYLLHMFLLSLCKRFFPVDVYSLAYRLGMPWLVYAAVLLIAWLMRKLPLVRRLVP